MTRCNDCGEKKCTGANMKLYNGKYVCFGCERKRKAELEKESNKKWDM